MKKPLYWTLIAIFSIIFLISAFVVVRYFVESIQNDRLMDELSNLKTTGPSVSTSSTAPSGSSGATAPADSTDPTGGDGPTSPTESTHPTPTEPQILSIYQTLYNMNNHLVGWITIPGTRVDYPVLQTPNTTEWQNYYLYRNFYGNETNHGSIYVRELCNVFEPSDNVVIYGHAMKDNSMFGTVTYYGERSYYEEHKYIQFDTIYEQHTYEVIAVFSTSGTNGVGYPYHSKNNFRNEEDFNAFINAIRGGVSNVYSFYTIDTPVEYGDKLITLSTCYDSVYRNGRLVVVAKRIN